MYTYGTTHAPQDALPGGRQLDAIVEIILDVARRHREQRQVARGDRHAIAAFEIDPLRALDGEVERAFEDLQIIAEIIGSADDRAAEFLDALGAAIDDRLGVDRTDRALDLDVVIVDRQCKAA